MVTVVSFGSYRIGRDGEAWSPFGYYPSGILDFYEDFYPGVGFPNSALGIAADQEAYVPSYVNGNYTGEYLVANRGEYLYTIGFDTLDEVNYPHTGYYNSVWRDYISLAWETGGAVWDLNLLRYATEFQEPELCKALASAFAETVAMQIVENMPVQVKLSDENFSFSSVAGNVELDRESYTITCPFSVTLYGRWPTSRTIGSAVLRIRLL